MEQEKRRPDKEIRAGRIRASIWRQPSEKNGRPTFSIRIEKSFRSRNGDWQSSSILCFPQELPRLVLAASRAYAATQLSQDNGDDEGAGS